MGVVLVAGGSGTLGAEVVRVLAEEGQPVRVLSRRDAPPGGPPPGAGWARGDVVTGEGLAAALAGVDAVVHAATNPPTGGDARAGRGAGGNADVAGTERLLAAAAAAGVGHLLYVSIVGIDRVPLGYYRAKAAAEALVAAGEVPWSILRITQFHPLIASFCQMLGGGRRPFLLPRVPLQPIDPADAARAVVAALGGGPGGRLPDAGGPEVRDSHDLARSWLAARDARRRIWPLPLPGRVGRGLRAGALTCPDRRVGVIAFEHWLAARAGRGPVSA
jgi:uncharacterized protein YbjT (DUF2867 family)